MTPVRRRPIMSRVVFAALALACLSGGGNAQIVSSSAGTRPVILCQSAVIASVTGSTSETALATCPVPGGLMGPNGRLRVTAYFTASSNANTKTVRVRYSTISGTIYGSGTLTTQVSGFTIPLEIANRGATNSQVGPQPGFSATGTLATGSADTTAATSVVITCQLASGTDTCSLESYAVVLMQGL